MRLLRQYPFVVTRSISEAPRDAGLFADRVDAYEAAPGSRHYQVIVNSVLVDGLRFIALKSTGHRVRLVDSEGFGVIVAHRGRAVIDDGRGAFGVLGDEGVLWQPGARTTTIPGPYVGLGLRVPSARFAAHVARNPEDGWRAGAAWPTRPSPRFVRTLRHVIRELDGEDPMPPASAGARGMARLLLDLLAERCVAPAREGPGAVSVAGLAQMRRAEEMLRAQQAEAVSIVALAGEIGVGTRALQLAFRRHRGTTPREFLATCRMETARDRLLAARPGECVATIALDCGIMHLGRFAARYRARYGEAPSVTLARARGRN